MNRLRTGLLLCVLLASAPGCFLKFWGKGDQAGDSEEKVKVFDIYGTVQSVTRTSLVIQSKKGGPMEFAFVDSSIKGSEFDTGAYVHVFFKQVEGRNEITMVVEKIE